MGGVILKDITIVMAIYKPKLEWLQEQLISLNNQTYANIRLLVWNDCPQDKTDYQLFFDKLITKFSFEIITAPYNLGSTRAFEKLTKKVQSPYVAYCDQDDVWLPDKLTVLVREIESNNSQLIYSDMQVINGKSEVIAQSITEIRPHHVFYTKKDAAKVLLQRNFINGCTILMKTEIAKQALPFPKSLVHDHWLALFVAVNGNISYSKNPLVNYRIHDGQQTGVLVGINSKEKYYEKKTAVFFDRINEIYKRMENTNIFNELEKVKTWSNLRMLYYKRPSINNMLNLLILAHIDYKTTFFELLLPVIPNSLFMLLVSNIRKGNI